MVEDIEELENLDASGIHARRLKAKEVITLKSGDNFIYPIADGKVKLSGGDQVLKISTFLRDNLEQGEEREGLRGEPDGSHPFDSLPDETEATNDFWSTSGNYIYRHHVEPRVKLYVPKEESFPIRLRYIDVTRATSTTPQMYCRNAVSMIVGTLMGTESCQRPGQGSRSSQY